jgi:hypothetical protein
MDAPQLSVIILATLFLAPVYARDPAESSNECAAALVQVDDKGVLSTKGRCGLSGQDAKAIVDALFQIRHELKPSFDQMRTLLAANNIILGAVLERLNARDVSLEGVLKISQLLANKCNTEPTANIMAESVQWKERYESLMESMKTLGDAASGKSAAQALQRLELEQIGRAHV